MNEKNYLVWLGHIAGIGSKTIEKLIEYFGGARQVYDASSEDLFKVPGINKNIVHNIIQSRDGKKLDRLVEQANKLGIDVLVKDDTEYPSNLRNIYDPPYILYKIGNILKQDEHAVAIVGARKASTYGKWAAYKFAGELARRGITVVSGMAHGIDTAAHQGALENGGRTIAVMGCGLDICYPKTNYSLMLNIQKKGAVLSEYPIGTPPLSNHFPARNRIISGIAKAVLVVEANLKSGSLITAGCALEQGRDVLAIPGNINSSLSFGTNKLIQEGAKMVTCVEDILEELGMEDPLSNCGAPIAMSSQEHDIYAMIQEHQPIHIEDLALKAKQSIHYINSMITILQLKGLVELLPGKILIVK